jgi:colicin import membrane protein
MPIENTPRNKIWRFSEKDEQLLTTMGAQTSLEKRQEPPVDHIGDKSGFIFSAAAHLALLGFFVLGLNWASKPPPAFEAVMWSEIQQKPTMAQTQSKPEPVKTPKPEPKPQPKPVPPVSKAPEPVAKPDIKLPTKKIEKKQEKKPEPKPEPKPQPKPKPEPKPEPEPKPKPAPKPEPNKPKPEPKFDPDLAKKLREQELARITGGAPATKSQSAGTSRNQAQYADKIRQYVRSKIMFPGAQDLSGNPEAVFEVRQMPNGEIISVTQKKSSGVPAWDAAVERAIQRSSPLPRAEDGSVEAVLVVSFRPKDVQ